MGGGGGTLAVTDTINVGANSDIDHRTETCVCGFLNSFAHVGTSVYTLTGRTFVECAHNLTPEKSTI